MKTLSEGIRFPDRITHRLSFDIYGKLFGISQHVPCLNVTIRSLLHNCYVSITVYLS
jgi:hypothetical protein